MRLLSSLFLPLAVALLVGVPNTATAESDDWLVTIGGTEIGTSRLLVPRTGWNALIRARDRRGASFAVSRTFAPGWSVRLLHERVDGISGVNRCPVGRGCLAVVIREAYRLDATELALTRTFRNEARLQPYVHVGLQRAAFQAGLQLPKFKEIEWMAGGGVSIGITDRTRVAVEWQDSMADIHAVRVNVGVRF